jgi:ribonuclease P protein component
LKSLTRNHRLAGKREFQSIFDVASKVSQKHLLALFKPNEKTHARIGIMVGKRIAKLAVERNQIKRVIRESFRQHQLPLSGFDIIVIARQQCDSLDKSQLREGIDKLWQKLITHCQKASS